MTASMERSSARATERPRRSRCGPRSKFQTYSPRARGRAVCGPTATEQTKSPSPLTAAMCPRHTGLMIGRVLMVLAFVMAVPAVAQGQRSEFTLVVHGGAGTIRRTDLTPQDDSAYRATLTRAIRAG